MHESVDIHFPHWARDWRERTHAGIWNARSAGLTPDQLGRKLDDWFLSLGPAVSHSGPAFGGRSGDHWTQELSFLFCVEVDHDLRSVLFSNSGEIEVKLYSPGKIEVDVVIDPNVFSPTLEVPVSEGRRGVLRRHSIVYEAVHWPEASVRNVARVNEMLATLTDSTGLVIFECESDIVSGICENGFKAPALLPH